VDGVDFLEPAVPTYEVQKERKLRAWERPTAGSEARKREKFIVPKIVLESTKRKKKTLFLDVHPAPLCYDSTALLQLRARSKYDASANSDSYYQQEYPNQMSALKYGVSINGNSDDDYESITVGGDSSNIDSEEFGSFVRDDEGDNVSFMKFTESAAKDTNVDIIRSDLQEYVDRIDALVAKSADAEAVAEADMDILPGDLPASLLVYKLRSDNIVNAWSDDSNDEDREIFPVQSAEVSYGTRRVEDTKKPSLINSVDVTNSLTIEDFVAKYADNAEVADGDDRAHVNADGKLSPGEGHNEIESESECEGDDDASNDKSADSTATFSRDRSKLHVFDGLSRDEDIQNEMLLSSLFRDGTDENVALKHESISFKISCDVTDEATPAPGDFSPDHLHPSNHPSYFNVTSGNLTNSPHLDCVLRKALRSQVEEYEKEANIDIVNGLDGDFKNVRVQAKMNESIDCSGGGILLGAARLPGDVSLITQQPQASLNSEIPATQASGLQYSSRKSAVQPRRTNGGHARQARAPTSAVEVRMMKPSLICQKQKGESVRRNLSSVNPKPRPALVKQRVDRPNYHDNLSLGAKLQRRPLAAKSQHPGLPLLLRSVLRPVGLHSESVRQHVSHGGAYSDTLSALARSAGVKK